jgi:hypothetical protein
VEDDLKYLLIEDDFKPGKRPVRWVVPRRRRGIVQSWLQNLVIKFPNWGLWGVAKKVGKISKL